MKKTYHQNLNTLPAFAQSGDIRMTWAQAHTMAVGCPREGYEKALVEMLSGWLHYADAVQTAWGAGVGKDYVLGPCWAQIGAGLRGLLNGDIGRMDGGTLDSLLCRTLEAEAFDPEAL